MYFDETSGTVSNWNRGGNTPAICQVIANNYTSFNHALALIDTNAGDFYGEWYSDVPLSGNASPGDTVNIQWFEMYNISGPEMRLTVLFFDLGNSVVGQTDFVTSGTTSAGWLGTIEPFKSEYPAEPRKLITSEVHPVWWIFRARFTLERATPLANPPPHIPMRLEEYRRVPFPLNDGEWRELIAHERL